MDKRLVELIPEIDLIEDPGLLAKVIDCWMDAIQSGGWELEDLKRIPFALSITDCTVDMVEHVRAVTRTCSEAERTMHAVYKNKTHINRDYLLAGALLHDIGKLLETGEEKDAFVKTAAGKLMRHPISGVILCARHGIPDEILHMIATHSKEGEGMRETAESKILFHADFMNFEIFVSKT